MNELDIFMRALEQRMNSLTIPGFEYIAEAITQARQEVELARAKAKAER